MHPVVAIICSDTISSLGICSLLKENFNADVSVIPTEHQQMQLDSILLTDFDFIIVDEMVMIQNLSSLLPHRNKVILITSTETKLRLEFAYISRHSSTESIVATLGKVFKSVSKKSVRNNGLSSREIEVLKLVAAGKINKEIASELNISINTVLTHRKNLTAKLGIKSVSGLSFYALMNGYIKP